MLLFGRSLCCGGWGRRCEFLNFRGRRRLGLVENLNNSGRHLLVIFDELAVLSKLQALEEESQSRQDEEFILVDTE